MPVKIEIKDRKYFNPIANGLGYSLNTSDYATLLQGHAMERLKFSSTVELSWRSEILDYDILGGDTIVCDSVNFLLDGMSVGDQVIYLTSDGLTSHTLTIAFVDANKIVFDTSPLTPAVGLAPSTADHLRGLEQQTGLIYKNGLIENLESFNTTSKLDQSDMSWYFDNVSGAFTDAQNKGEIQSYVTGDVSGRFVGFISDNEPFSPQNSVQQFEITQEFVIFPYYREGELNNLKNLLAPEDIYRGDKSLKQVFQFDFRTTYADINTTKNKQIEDILGSVGYFNENYNGFNNQYSVGSLAYTNNDLAQPADSLLKTTSTNVSYSVNSADGTFQVGDAVMVYFSLLPDGSLYKESKENFADVWHYRLIRLIIDDPIQNSGSFSNAQAVFISANQIDISFDFLADNSVRITDDSDNYLFVTSVADQTVPTEQSDKVGLIVDTNQVQIDTDIDGLIPKFYVNFFDHATGAVLDNLLLGYTDFKGYIENGITACFGFTVARATEPIIDSVRLKLVAYNDSSGDVFDLQSVTFDVPTDQKDSNNSQAIDIDTTRGFNLADGSQFNFEILKNGTFFNVVGWQDYYGALGLKIDWQDWIANANANNAFYDISEPNNGLNQKSSRYSLKEGYVIQMRLEVDMASDGNITTYKAISPEFDIKDFGEGSEFTCLQETTKIDGTDIEGNIIQNGEDTILKATMTAVTLPVDIADYYGIIYIHKKNIQGYGDNQLSSLLLPPSNNLIEPLDGDVLLNFTQVGNDLILKARVDNNQLEDGVDYDWKAEVRLKDSEILLRAYSSGYSDGYE
jgi:hypothetical protein